MFIYIYKKKNNKDSTPINVLVQFDQNIRTAVSLTILIRLHTVQTWLAMAVSVCIKALKFLRSTTPVIWRQQSSTWFFFSIEVFAFLNNLSMQKSKCIWKK